MEFSCAPGVLVGEFAASAVAMRRRVAEDFVAIYNDRRVTVTYSTSVESFLDAWTAARLPGSVEETVRLLDEIEGGDPDAAHGCADDILLAFVPAQVAAAYRRLVARCDWWATA